MAYFLLRSGEPGLATEWTVMAEGSLDDPRAFTGDSPAFPDRRAAIPASLYFGEAGVWCVGALVAGAQDDRSAVERRIGRFVAVADASPVDRPDAVSGAAGLLLGAAVMVEELGPPVDDRLVAVGDRLGDWLARLAGRAVQTPGALGWLGAAHGWSGIAHAILRWSQATGTVPGPEVVGLLGALGHARLATGLWPPRAGSDEVWPGWCHGSAGWAQLWALAWEVLGDDGALARAEAAAAHAVATEDAGPGLCCGDAGSAYAALALYRATGDATWLAHAHRLAARAAGTAPDEHSLWQGDLGVSLLLAELEDPSSAAMPLYRRR